MFISKIGCPESRGNHTLTSKCRFKNPKIDELHYSLEFKIRTRCVRVSLMVDLDKKYRNKIEMDKTNSVTYTEYVYF